MSTSKNISINQSDNKPDNLSADEPDNEPVDKSTNATSIQTKQLLKHRQKDTYATRSKKSIFKIITT